MDLTQTDTMARARKVLKRLQATASEMITADMVAEVKHPSCPSDCNPMPKASMMTGHCSVVSSSMMVAYLHDSWSWPLAVSMKCDRPIHTILSKVM